MRKWLGSLIVSAVLLVPAFVFAGQFDDVQHIFSERNWIFLKSQSLYFDDPDGTKVMYETIEFYAHPEGQWYLSKHIIFGELARLTYGLIDGNDVIRDYAVAVEKDSKWKIAKADKFSANPIKDTNGKITGTILVLLDKNGNEIVRREIKRK